MRRGVAALLLALVAGCPGPTLPSTDVCQTPGAGEVDALEAWTVTPEGDPVRRIVDGDHIPTVIGGQGATMIGLRLELVGGAPPACVGETTSLVAGDGSAGDGGVAGEIGYSGVPVNTYPRGATRMTGAIWILVPYSGQGPIAARLTVAAAGRTLRRAVRLDFGGAPDAN